MKEPVIIVDRVAEVEAVADIQTIPAGHTMKGPAAVIGTILEKPTIAMMRAELVMVVAEKTTGITTLTTAIITKGMRKFNFCWNFKKQNKFILC